ncbi:MAG TPA: peptide chain release factor 2 [Candidatus Polarisedimenticolaceae bacterium]|nr:peptide chain release factor 2 [Candidatus Polarisedimenticolaceae bacterium]
MRRRVSWPRSTCRNSASGHRVSRKRSIAFGGSFDIDAKGRRLAEVEEQLSRPEVWGDTARSRELQQGKARLQEDLAVAATLQRMLEDAQTLLELMREGEEVGDDLVRAVSDLDARTQEIELATLLTGEHDASDAIVEIHPGAGGTESQDWAEMLMRMYTRWAERRGFKVDTLDLQAGEEAGIKSVTLGIRGANAYGYLRTERGVHRLVRISPFDAQSRRHTSFASLDVVPEVEGDVDVQIEEKDLRVDTYRSSGAGGQHVNVTDSAVRITHLPTGIVVSCQNERSQHRNRDVCMQVLRAKLHARAEEEAQAKMAAEVGEKKKIEWGSQIRSYVLAPYRLVKDHRTGVEVGDADRVLDGDLDGFIRASLASMREKAATA